MDKPFTNLIAGDQLHGLIGLPALQSVKPDTPFRHVTPVRTETDAAGRVYEITYHATKGFRRNRIIGAKS